MLEMTHCLSLIKASVVCASTKLPEYFYVVNTATNHSGEEIIFRNRAVEYHSSMISFLAWAMQPASRAGALHLWSLDEVEHYEQDWNHLQSRMKFTASLLINVVQSGDKDGVEHWIIQLKPNI